MKKLKEKGFTLIELLAVIVILAIIALIAVPVIINIINKVNKSAFKDTAYAVVSAGELYFAEQQLNVDGMKDVVVFEFPDNTGDLQIKGNIPNEGIMIINSEGDIALTISNERYCVKKDYENNDLTIIEDLENCAYPDYSNGVMYSSNYCIISGKCEPGTLVKVKVNDSQKYNFNVVNDENGELTLLMDRNIGLINWYTTGNNATGPIQVLTELNNLTSSWTKIPTIEKYTYDNNLNGVAKKNGYQKVTIKQGETIITAKDGTENKINGTTRSRLITFEEANAEGIGCNNANRSCPTWMYKNLTDTGDSNHYSYWLLSTYDNGYEAKTITTQGCTYHAYTNNAAIAGIRPVITLSK